MIRRCFLGVILLALAAAGIQARTTHAVYASTGTQVTDCTFTTLQTDLQAGGDWYYAPGQCVNPIIFAGTITVSQNASLTAQGNDITLQGDDPGSGSAYQLLYVNGGVSFSLTGLTLTGGQAVQRGGAIYNSGTLSVTSSTISNNFALYGGAIYNAGTAVINGSTFSGNSSGPSSGLGAAILNDRGDTLTVDGSTFFGNSAGPNSWGGAIYNNDGTVGITSSTFAENSAYQGGAIYNFGAVRIGGSIVADSAGGNCVNNTADTRSAAITDTGYNLESGTDCGFSATGSIQNTDPRFAVDTSSNPLLTENGGPTQTIALQQGSPAIDQIPTSYDLPGTTTPLCDPTDQRGFARPDGGETTCDIGAYESIDPATSAPSITQEPQSQTITAGQAATLAVTATGTPAPTYQWYSSPTGAAGSFTAIPGATGASYSTGTLTTSGTTSYYVEVANSAGSVDSSTVTVTVNPGNAARFIVSAPATTTVGSAVNVTATAEDAYGNTATGYGGTVHFTSTDNRASLPADSVLTNGSGSFSITLMTAGTQSITATDTASSAVSGTSGTITVAPAATTTQLVSSATPSVLKQSVTFTATVAAVAPGGGTPTGNVTFKDGTTTLGTVTLSSTGTASLFTSTLTAGTHSITAFYSGNANYTGSTSTSVSQQVRYTVKVLSTSSLTVVLQLLDYNNANVSTSKLPVTAECVVAYSQTVPTTCGATPVQTINKAFGFTNSYKGMGPAYSYGLNSRGLTKGQQYYLLAQTDGDPIWHAVAFTA